MKNASSVIPHNSVPSFIGIWALIGALIILPFKYNLLITELNSKNFSLILFFLILLKGAGLWYLIFIGQKVKEFSFSSSQIAGPIALIGIASLNSFLGESLILTQWIALILLSVLSVFYLLKGHIKEASFFNKNIKFDFFILIVLLVLLAVMDHIVLRRTNWFYYLILSNLSLLIFSYIKDKNNINFKNIVSNKYALYGGSFFAIYEFLKFYLLDNYIAVSIMSAIESGLMIVLLILSATLYKEQTVYKQFVWGIVFSGLVLTIIFSKF